MQLSDGVYWAAVDVTTATTDCHQHNKDWNLNYYNFYHMVIREKNVLQTWELFQA